MAKWWFILPTLFSVSPQEDAAKQAAALVEKLASESVEERDLAARALRDLGKSALSQLERAAKREDREVRGRAAELIQKILRDLSRPDRLGKIRPPLRRQSLNLENASLESAVRAVFDPYDVASEFDMALIKPSDTVSLRLQEATLWEAFDAFCKATGAAPRSDYFQEQFSGWCFTKTKLLERTRAFTKEEVRLVGQVGTYSGPPEWQGDLAVVLHLLLPPGCGPRVRIEGMKGVDDTGGTATVKSLKGWDEVIRPSPQWGRATCQVIHRGRIARKDLGATGTLKLKGELSLIYPHDMDRVEIDLATFKPPVTRNVGPLRVKIGGLSFEKMWYGGFEIGPSEVARQVGGIEILHAWCEDAKDRWIGDLLFREVSLDKPFGLGQGGPFRNKGDPVPTRFVLACYEGEDVVKIPFSIGEFPLPPIPKDSKTASPRVSDP